MKSRSGFISNSSTTSFVFVGVLLDKALTPAVIEAYDVGSLEDPNYPGDPDYDKLDRLREDHEPGLVLDDEHIGCKGKIGIGVYVTGGDYAPPYLPKEHQSLDAQMELAQGVREKLGLTKEEAPAVIITGEYPS